MTEKPWLAHYPPEIPHTLQYPSMPVQEYLTQAHEQFPEKVAIHFLGKDVTYNELYDSAMKFANYLQKLGIQKGDRVAIMLPNSPQAVISFYGVLYAGGVVVMTNPLYTEREIAYQMTDSGARLIVTLDLLYPRVAKVLKETKLENVVVTAIKDYLPFPKNIIYPFIQVCKSG